jgi:methyltransferase (TIGR00027 family)
VLKKNDHSFFWNAAMRADRPSRTAQHNALFRAIEQGLPHPLFQDPWARRFLRGRYRLVAGLPAPFLARAIDRRWPGPRAAVCVRTRYIDDAIGERTSAGLDQLVLLGAGFDSRAHRLPGIDRVRVFEVDHPTTQAMKRNVVGRPPAHVVYVPFDFSRDRLAEVLAGGGFEAGRRTLFVWEGVTNYLDEASVDATLRFVAGSGTDLIFTYIDRTILDGAPRFEGAAESMAYVRRLGEPFTFGFDPAALPLSLRGRGLELLEDLSLAAAAERYYAVGRPPVSAFYHVAVARCLG